MLKIKEIQKEKKTKKKKFTGGKRRKCCWVSNPAPRVYTYRLGPGAILGPPSPSSGRFCNYVSVPTRRMENEMLWNVADRWVSERLLSESSTVACPCCGKGALVQTMQISAYVCVFSFLSNLTALGRVYVSLVINDIPAIYFHGTIVFPLKFVSLNWFKIVFMFSFLAVPVGYNRNTIIWNRNTDRLASRSSAIPTREDAAKYVTAVAIIIVVIVLVVAVCATSQRWNGKTWIE